MDMLGFYLSYYGLAYVIKCLGIHFVIALSLGSLGYCLTWTTLSHMGLGTHTRHLPLLVGVSLAVTSHWFVDFVIDPVFPLA